MTLRVTVVDVETGEADEKLVAAGDYVLVCAEPCYMDSARTYRGGRTHVLTVKGRRPDGRATAGQPDVAEAAPA